jgi:proline iminopeptidase
MPTLLARDGTGLFYSELGDGPPLVCLPGGPMLAAEYLGDLGGLSAHRRLIRLDLRGTGRSGIPADPASCRCDHLVDDVEALREHLGLDRIDLLGHSAGANLAALHVARHPDRVGRLLLVTPSTYAVGLTATADDRRDVVRRRADEPSHEQVSTAFERIAAGQAEAGDWEAIVPFTYGRWDDTARAHAAAQRYPEAAAAFGAEGAYDPPTTRAALAAFPAPVLVIAGGKDMAAPARVVAEYAALFPNATLHTLATGGHFPWLDDPAWFNTTLTTFLR